ncbi:MAG: hypothetical protein IT578_07720 [Verrucomicrobiae bacterium]|nr:hypothetical protein [Verrucomicrobiae bacterium]
MLDRGPSLLAALASVVLFTAMMSAHFVPSFGGVDENGYLVTAKRLATTGDVRKPSSDPYEFVSGNWVLVDKERHLYAAKYPIGYPGLCAVAWKLGGSSAVFWVNPFLAALSVFGIFWLGRTLASDLAGAFAAILLATNPMHAYFSLSALSHTASTCFSLWGMFFFWQWGERGGGWRAMLGAAATAWAVSARYTEALLALPAAAIVIFRFLRLWRARGDAPLMKALFPWVRDLALIFLAGAVAMAPLIWQHIVAFGGPLHTGYAMCGESTGFGMKWFLKNWALMLARLDYPGLYLLFPLGLAGMGWFLAHEPRRGLFLALWILPTLLLYTAYYWAPAGDGPAYIRFFVSLFPPLIVAGMGLLCRATPTRPLWAVASGLLVLLIAGVNQSVALERLHPMLARNLFSAGVSDLVRAKLPENAVLLADDGPLQYLEFMGDYTLYGQGMFDRKTIQRWTKVLDDGEPHPFHREKALAIKALLDKKREPELAEIQRGLIAKHLQEGRRVAMLGNQAVVRAWKARLGARFAFVPLGDCLQFNFRREGELLSTPWVLTEITLTKSAPAAPPPPRGPTMEEILGRIEQARYRLDLAREEYAEKYPGAKESQERLAAMERELGELHRQQSRLAAIRRTSLPPPPPSSPSQPPPAGLGNTNSTPSPPPSSSPSETPPAPAPAGASTNSLSLPLPTAPQGTDVRVTNNVLMLTVSNTPSVGFQSNVSTHLPSPPLLPPP